MRLALMMLDGLTIAGAVHVVGLGVSTEGLNVPAGGSTGNATPARERLADLVDRGGPDEDHLFVPDGANALRKAVRDVFGEHALARRSPWHKECNVCDLLPDRRCTPTSLRIGAPVSPTSRCPNPLRSAMLLVECAIDKVSPVVINDEWDEDKVRQLFEAAARARQHAASAVARAEATYAKAHPDPRFGQEVRRGSDQSTQGTR
jgi:hypothetical protein